MTRAGDIITVISPLCSLCLSLSSALTWYHHESVRPKTYPKSSVYIVPFEYYEATYWIIMIDSIAVRFGAIKSPDI